MAEELSGFDNYISLGYFCGVAEDLERIGLRSFSSPFDWNISEFESVILLLQNKFENFMCYKNLIQNEKNRSIYKDSSYNFYFFHDFNEYKSLSEQFDIVKEKYDRRIIRFFENIKKPTLFIRYISSGKLNNLGRPVELEWIEQNYDSICSILKSFNKKNKVIFIGDNKCRSSLLPIYLVKVDHGDTVCRHPILRNKELSFLLKKCHFKDREKNLKRYSATKFRKRNIFVKCLKKTLSFIKGFFLNKYTHDKTYR